VRRGKSWSHASQNSKAQKKPTFRPPPKELVEAAAKQAAQRKRLRSSKDSEIINLSDSSKLLFGDDLDELPSDKEDELLKNTPVQIPASTQAVTPAAATTAQAEDDQPSRPVPKRSGQLIDSGCDTESELQLAGGRSGPKGSGAQHLPHKPNTNNPRPYFTDKTREFVLSCAQRLTYCFQIPF
jgi:hypothetical protein